MKERRNGPGRARAVRRVVAVAAAATIVLTACRPAGFSYENQAKQAQRTTPNKRPWFCNSVGNGTPLSGHGNGSHVHPIYEGKTKGPLSWDDCLALSRQLDQTLKSVKGLETKAKGEAAGWRQVAEYIPGLGTHHAKVGGTGTTPGSAPSSEEIQRIVKCLQDKGINLNGGIPDFTNPAVADALKACGAPVPTGGSVPGIGPFDPAKPPLLIYGGPNPDSPLVGVAFVFFGGSTPPEAYAGGNDWWHLHTKVCIGPNRDVLAGAEEISDEQCKAMGGTQRNLGALPGAQGGNGVWLLHVWMAPPYEYRPDIFVSGHPCLAPDGVLPQSDPCWKTAHRDPSLGAPSTSMPMDHGGHDTPTTPTTPTTAGPPPDDHGGHDH